jgi:chromosome segregation ATPase
MTTDDRELADFLNEDIERLETEIAALKAERDRLQSEADYTRTERDTVMGYLKDAEIAVAALKAERDHYLKLYTERVDERDRLQAALDGRVATIALHKILNLAQHGTPPDYHRWISTLDNIAEIARRALDRPVS